MNPVSSITMLESNKNFELGPYYKVDQVLFWGLLKIVGQFLSTGEFLLKIVSCGNKVLNDMTECEKLGATGPLVLHLPGFTLVYWYNLNQEQNFFAVRRFKWHFTFEFGPVTVGV